MINRVILTRFKHSTHGTFGLINLWDKIFFTLEPPWKDNKSNVSCIPLGNYLTERYNSPHFGKVYQVGGVENRTVILCHSGNYGGDTTLGLKTHTQGCILLGKSMANFGGQLAVANSKIAIREFEKELKKESFILEIRSN